MALYRFAPTQSLIPELITMDPYYNGFDKDPLLNISPGGSSWDGTITRYWQQVPSGLRTLMCSCCAIFGWTGYSESS
jgi:hypothetical protein